MDKDSPAGWYAHPQMANTMCFWDGERWTDKTAPAAGSPQPGGRPEWVRMEVEGGPRMTTRDHVIKFFVTLTVAALVLLAIAFMVSVMGN